MTDQENDDNAITVDNSDVELEVLIGAKERVEEEEKEYNFIIDGDGIH